MSDKPNGGEKTKRNLMIFTALLAYITFTEGTISKLPGLTLESVYHAH